jgi:hypothetical protein
MSTRFTYIRGVTLIKNTCLHKSSKLARLRSTKLIANDTPTVTTSNAQQGKEPAYINVTSCLPICSVANKHTFAGSYSHAVPHSKLNKTQYVTLSSMKRIIRASVRVFHFFN